jgi:UDP-N-acetylglucosamine--N-acetylmuramyl-(pentapeptide) pyrophosphoryl-undecaprenol N-acetylglucosamine transferase
VLRRFGAEIVISVGGYAAAPAVLAARLAGTPVALVNPDALPGRTNRLAGRFAKRVFVGFPGAAAGFASGGDPGRVHCLGIPLRRALTDAFRNAPARREARPPYRLFVFGGSQGARQLNDAMIAAAPRLADAHGASGLEIFHQTGEADRERVAGAYAAAGLRAEVAAFEPEMVRRYRWADLALCRSGALTVAELTLAGLPALLVPYPFAAHDEQTANARELVEAGAAIRLDPQSFCADDVTTSLSMLLRDPARLARMSACAAKLARPDAAERIVEECATLFAAQGVGLAGRRSGG